jgi:hypothetical protein
VSNAREREEPEGQLPWPLAREELGAFTEQGLTEVSVTGFLDHQTPPVRRFRARFERP